MGNEDEVGAVSMVTRCPSCTTLFRVTPQQLQAHRGQVRCGRCMSVFDGFRMLATLPDRSIGEQPGLRPAGEPPAIDGENVPEVPPVKDAPHSEGIPADQSGPGTAAEPVHEPAPLGVLASPEVPGVRVTAAPTAAIREAAQREPSSATGVSGEQPAPDTPRPRVPLAWSWGSALLLLVLGVQVIYAYRVELVASFPKLKPAMVQFCDLLGCGVPLPQRPKLVTIEASDMQVQDPSRPAVIQLTATLRNQAGYEVGYPALDLVLTNTKEHTLARRIFMPDEYLERSRSAGAGIPANAEVTVRLVLDTGDLGAAGFRLALLPGR